MRYKPLILALLLSFSLPTYAAKDAPKEKAAAVKKAEPVKKEKEAAKADVKKETLKKQAVKEKEEDKKAVKAKVSKEKETADKNERASAKNKPAKAAEATADNKKANRKAEEPKETVKDKKAAAAKPGKTKEQDKKPVEDKKDSKAKEPVKKAEPKETKTKEPAKKAAEDKKERQSKEPVKKAAEDKKADTKETKAKEPAKKTVEDKKDAKKDTKAKEQNKKDEPKAEPKAVSSADNDFKAAVTAAANDIETKKSLAKRNEGFIIHVNATLKQLQQTRNNLSGINRKQRDAWEKFQKLNADANQLKAEVSNTRAQISRFVSGNYKNSQPNAVALFLKNADAGQKTRFLRYTRYINNANDQVMRDLEKQQKELAAQEQKINNELAYLKKLQANIQASLRQQGVTNTAEQAESRRQNAQMAKEAQKKINHRENEQRLNNLLKDLEKRKAEQRKAEAEARKKAAEARLAAAEKARKEQAAAQQKAEAERAAMSTLTDEDMKLQAPNTQGLTVSNANSFSRMQGRLKKPVNGTLAGLFGQDRGDGEVWKGVFYNTVPAPVSSIASGTVTFAGELEGYGKVVVLDHGDGYVSIYSGLSEIDIAQNYAVNAGSKIGTSGTLPSGETGLYLEVRYNGQVMNPLSWIN
ncbi:murein hydrolase activator EnvC family protein [Neisseria sp. DTU_2021_1001991_1_SI_NGA_ILE_055]|uniref:murein hydrolase activator EnvC family protein n=1 Tax=Neisseria sp. DTU_2021_1001991_1_SI_NGA_ILE_055 TaxID=3077590 RepID=UPI0028ED1487|nr:peptidoglycan DD-metalloendopeptidase family protein [Neisseria sp. DTU_2021_1001991_1_SI_NGA_ILE_055]WNS83824.1 peptidoglycan DD-metalloendopeptidase family protein [Neisseria sp. DTU_2021_1001991_1_SI_NGA_ILE_055]